MIHNSRVAAGVRGNANFLDPDRIVAGLDLRPGDHVADLGAGHGYFTIPLARAVGAEGKVYAIDIQKPVLDVIRSKARELHLLNIEYVRADLEEPGGSRIKNHFCELALVANILTQADYKDNVLREAWRILREGGLLAIVEWDAVASPMGPALGRRIKKEDARSLAVQAGFEFDREFSAGAYHYGLLFVKK